MGCQGIWNLLLLDKTSVIDYVDFSYVLVHCYLIRTVIPWQAFRLKHIERMNEFCDLKTVICLPHLSC